MTQLPFLNQSDKYPVETLHQQWLSLSNTGKISQLNTCNTFMVKFFGYTMGDWLKSTPEVLIPWTNEIIRSAHEISSNMYQCRHLNYSTNPIILQKIMTDVNARGNRECIYQTKRTYLNYDEHSAKSIHDIIDTSNEVGSIFRHMPETDSAILELIYADNDNISEERQNVDSIAVGVVSRARDASFTINISVNRSFKARRVLNWFCSPYAHARTYGDLVTVRSGETFDLDIFMYNSEFTLFKSEWGLSDIESNDPNISAGLTLQHMFLHSMLIAFGNVSVNVPEQWYTDYCNNFRFNLTYDKLNMLLVTAFWLNYLFDEVHDPTLNHNIDKGPRAAPSPPRATSMIREVSPRRATSVSREVSPRRATSVSREVSPRRATSVSREVSPLIPPINKNKMRNTSRMVITPY
jgi:hypothetical protein